MSESSEAKQRFPDKLALEPPEGQVPLGSPFYVERPPIESDCYAAILRPDALIRVKAPRQMGKTSLMSRILSHANQHGHQIASLNFQTADAEFLTNLDLFLQWFCASLAEELSLSDRLDQYWKGVLGSKSKCTKYFQRYLLSELDSPLTLGLDEVDQIFQHPEIAVDFFGLLRAWHEKGKNEPLWQKLRLVIVHSKEVYIPLNINQSPFNVGLPVELQELDASQVQDLALRHHLDMSDEDLQQLMAMVGGHPFLLRVALYQLARDRLTLEDLLKLAPTESGLYANHLRRHWQNLQSDAQLIAALQRILATTNPVEIPSAEAFKLRSMGLIKFQGNAVAPLCDLYQIYFRDRLAVEHSSQTSTYQPAQNQQRHSNLATIVFTDVMASTEMMSQNQSHAIALLERDFQIIRDLCQQYDGQVLKSLGDGLLLYFQSAVKAVSCAQMVQHTFAIAAQSLPESDILYHRIGIHLGEIFFDGDDVMGIGVNMAARLQTHAEPGSICISKTVYEVVKDHLPLQISYLGLKELKGISDSVPLYKVSI